MIKKLNEIKKMDLECGVFSVYDMDGKTTQEIFNQFFAKINDVIDATNASVTLIDYLVNVGLQEEVAEKLIQWLEDGTLKDLVDENVLKDINDKLSKAVNDIQDQRDELEGLMYRMDEGYNAIARKEGCNVKYYGANGDGLTDDTEAIKKTIFAASYEADKTVYIPSGTYLISETIDIPKGVAIIGNAGSVIKYATNNISINLNGSDITIRDIVIDGNDVQTTNAVTNTSEGLSKDITIQNVIFKNFGGTQLNLMEFAKANGVYITNCVFKDISAKQIQLINLHTSSKNIIIKDNKFVNCTGSSGDNYVVNIEETNTRYAVNAIIDSNVFESCVDASIRVNAKNVTITNNTFNIQQGMADNTAILISNSINTKIKNNTYNIDGTFSVLSPIIKGETSKEVIIKGDIVSCGMPITDSSYTKKKHLYVFNDCDVMIDGVTVTGTYHSEAMFELNNMRSAKVKNCNIQLEAGTVPVIVSLTGKSMVEITDNNIEAHKGKSLLISKDINTKGVVKICNNSMTYNSDADTKEHDSIRLENFNSAIIEGNRLKNAITVKDFNALELNNNTLTRLYVESDTYDIKSQNNTFKGNAHRACYELSCHTTQKCKLLSKNNYNESNYRLICFYSAKGNFLDANSMDIKTIDDINSDEVQAHKNEYIAKDSNITTDIYKQCYVKTTQEHPRFTWFSYDQPLIDYRKPNGTIIYNASTGKSSVYITHNGITRVTQL